VIERVTNNNNGEKMDQEILDIYCEHCLDGADELVLAVDHPRFVGLCQSCCDYCEKEVE
tara:strand:- start:39 stop:215 length:177 start_codon:yes stop_codon:yes gene_type:complete